MIHLRLVTNSNEIMQLLLRDHSLRAQKMMYHERIITAHKHSCTEFSRKAHTFGYSDISEVENIRAFAEHMGSVPITHIRTFTTTDNSRSR